MAANIPNVLEIDRKLRDDFRRRVKDFGVSTDTTDPLLSVLFRTVAQQIDQVYGDTAQLRQSLLHELMTGLEVQQYLATPAQAAVRLVTETQQPRVLRAGTEINAVAASGERLVFGLDATCEISGARLAMALSYQDQGLRLLGGVEMSDALQALRPSLEAIPVQLGAQPALYLAVEGLSAQLLSRHGLFFELGPGSYPVQHALSHEPWWIFNEDGELEGSGLMRPARGNAGVMYLHWQQNEDGSAGGVDRGRSSMLDAPLPAIPDGFYTGRQFVFPPMTEEMPFRCRVPRLLEPALTRMLQRDAAAVLTEPRLWIKIPMPAGIPALQNAVNGIVLHAMTASNVYARNQTITFARDGYSVPVTKTGGMPEFLVAPLTVMSTENEVYEAGTRAGVRAGVGRFDLRNGRLTMVPGHFSDGSEHRGCNVRLWLTNGELANRVGPGDLSSFANAASLTGVRLAPLTAASGGSNGEEVASAERRFADALLTRGRIVTRQDMEVAALGVDRRVLSVTTQSGMERGENGLRRIERLQVVLDADGFTRPEIELPALQSQMQLALGSRLVHGSELRVEFEWNR